MRNWLLGLPLLAGCVGDPDPCAIRAEVTSIDDAIDLINVLPRPVTVPCVVAALDRPLGVELTSDTFSAQPAQGARSPRIFLRVPNLDLSVVPVGLGRELLEFGEVHPSGLTVKAELAFPIEEEVTRADAFEKALANPAANETGCAVCHFEEIEVAPGEFASTPLRPPPQMVVPLELLESEREACEPRDDPYRCAMLGAVLDHGRVDPRPFPEHYDTLTSAVP